MSVRGFSHEACDEVCQDVHDVRVSGGWLVAVAADGAGSAEYGGDGARLVCQGVQEHLAQRLSARPLLGPRRFDETGLKSLIRNAVEAGRDLIALEAQARSASLSQFYTTVVGCLVAPGGGGLFFHIGDGAGCAMVGGDFDRYVMSPPENGSYAETTFFVTQDEWEQHLRFTRIDREYDVVLLMSDGVMPMALKGPARAPEPVVPFIEPIDRYLRSVDRGTGETALAATLSSDRVRDITGDDKTLVWAARDE